MTADIRFRYRETNGIRLHTAESGPEDGPVALLLHGFPELWYGWRKQIPALAEAGFHVVAPDQRGYNFSDKPQGVRSYRLDALVADIFGLIDGLERDMVSVVGHDWGGVVAWMMALRSPERIASLGIVNCPHPAVFRRNLRHSLSQLRKSWYIGFFQLPVLPEALLARRSWSPLSAAMIGSSRRDTFTEEEIETYRRAWAQPGAITAMLNWYRAGLRHMPELPADGRVLIPTEIIWGNGDVFLTTEMAEQSAAMCDAGTLTLVPHATHWVQHEEPDLVNERLQALLSRDLSTDRRSSAGSRETPRMPDDPHPSP